MAVVQPARPQEAKPLVPGFEIQRVAHPDHTAYVISSESEARRAVLNLHPIRAELYKLEIFLFEGGVQTREVVYAKFEGTSAALNDQDATRSFGRIAGILQAELDAKNGVDQKVASFVGKLARASSPLRTSLRETTMIAAYTGLEMRLDYWGDLTLCIDGTYFYADPRNDFVVVPTGSPMPFGTLDRNAMRDLLDSGSLEWVFVKVIDKVITPRIKTTKHAAGKATLAGIEEEIQTIHSSIGGADTLEEALDKIQRYRIGNAGRQTKMLEIRSELESAQLSLLMIRAELSKCAKAKGASQRLSDDGSDAAGLDADSLWAYHREVAEATEPSDAPQKQSRLHAVGEAFSRLKRKR